MRTSHVGDDFIVLDNTNHVFHRRVLVGGDIKLFDDACPAPDHSDYIGAELPKRLRKGFTLCPVDFPKGLSSQR